MIQENNEHNHRCLRIEDLAKLREKVKNIVERQERHHESIHNIEAECRAGRMTDMKEVEEKLKEARDGMDDKFEKVMEAVGKSGKDSLKMMLTIVIVFGGLFSIYALLFSRGGGQGLHLPLP